MRARVRAPVVLACLLLPAAGCGEEGGCDLDARTRELGGFGVTDCGLARLDDAGGASGSVDRCAIDARASGNTFRAIYELADGSLEALVHGASGYAVLRATSGGGSIERAACEGSAVVERAGRRFVECTGMGSFETICQ